MSSRLRTLTLLAAVVVLAIGAFLVLRPADDGGSEGDSAGRPAAVTSTAATTATAAPEPRPVTQIRLVGGSPAGGAADITATKGETVRFTVTSDAPEEIHVHGYDIERTAAPGQPARFRFTANLEGRFEVEAHGSGTPVAELTIAP